MKTLSIGTYLGSQTDTLFYKNVIVSKTEYREKEDQNWHCHENPFFAYFLKGGNYEYRESKKIKCSPGTLLFYNPGEPHCNTAYSDGCKIFHVEVDNNWFNGYSLNADRIKADVINDRGVKNMFVNILSEFEIRDQLSGNSIESLIVYLLNVLTRSSEHPNHVPSWINKFNAVVQADISNDLTLENISKLLNIHPVTLSKEFPKFYHCSFGKYIRQIRIEKSLPFLAKKNIAVNDIAYLCGFSEASNFIRTFKKLKGVTPNVYRKFM